MVSSRIRVALGLALAFAFASFSTLPSFADSAKGRLVDRELQSKNFAGNRVGTSPVRKMVVYLPAGYDDSSKHYPVIYFLPSPFENYRLAFDQRDAQGLLDRAIAAGMIDKFILVCIDMTTPLGSSWYVNSPVTGNWEDFMVQELVPYMDANFRTFPNRDSRGIAGDFMGGYGAIRFGMKYPNVFGVVYALHPVGTGSGLKIMDSLPIGIFWPTRNAWTTRRRTVIRRFSPPSFKHICQM
jgi:enterochelin esterase-like enzyme